MLISGASWSLLESCHPALSCCVAKIASCSYCQHSSLLDSHRGNAGIDQALKTTGISRILLPTASRSRFTWQVAKKKVFLQHSHRCFHHCGSVAIFHWELLTSLEEMSYLSCNLSLFNISCVGFILLEPYKVINQTQGFYHPASICSQWKEISSFRRWVMLS